MPATASRVGDPLGRRAPPSPAGPEVEMEPWESGGAVPSSPAAPFADRQRAGGEAAAGRRGLLVKRGWLGRPLHRWYELEQDALVYYASRDAQQPKGRIPLGECTLSSAPTRTEGPTQASASSRGPLEIARPGKRPCTIHEVSEADLAGIMLALRPAAPEPAHAAAGMLRLPDSPQEKGPMVPATSTQGQSLRGQSLPARGGAARGGEDKAVEPWVPDERWPHRESLQQQAQAAGEMAATTPRAASWNSPPTSQDGSPLGSKGDGGGAFSSIQTDVVSLDNLDYYISKHRSARAAAGDPAGAAAPPAAASSAHEAAKQAPAEPTDSSTTDTAEAPPGGSPSCVTTPRAPPREMDPEVPGPDTTAADAYQGAMKAMWNYDLEQAGRLLEPFRSSSVYHAAAYAEAAILRVALTGRKEEAQRALELVRCAEELCDRSSQSAASNMAIEVLAAELLLMRSGLQVVLGARLRALFNLRHCWGLYRRLENAVANGTLAGICTVCVDTGTVKLDEPGVYDAAYSYHDLRGRINFGLGFFYLATSLLPASLGPLLRLAGFVMDRQIGKAYLAENVEGDLAPRSTLSAIMLSMYHLDLEPDMPRAGKLLVASLARTPENVLLHWSGSLLAWRNTCIAQAVELTEKALWCCGEEIGSQAVFLRYELGMLHFICMDWRSAHAHLRFVYETVKTEKVFFPYQTLISVQLAAACFHLGGSREEEGEQLCRECVYQQDWSGGMLKLENDFSRIAQTFLRHRAAGRQLFAFETLYLLRQFPKIAPAVLLEVQAALRKAAEPHVRWLAQLREGSSASEKEGAARPARQTSQPTTEEELGVALEVASALTVECVILFYLGDVAQAMTFVPELAVLCGQLPSHGQYIAAHGYYWCGRMFALSDQRGEALRCLREAKAVKKYPFNIGEKVSKVLDDLERPAPAAP